MAQYELNVIDYWLIIKKRKYLILLAAGLVVVFTFLFSEMFKPSPLYEASARVKFDRTSTVAQQLIETMSFSNANDLNSQTEFIRGFPVMERVAMELGRVPANVTPEEKRSATYLNTVYNLGQEIKTQREGDTNIIRITATSDQPEMAEKTANSVANAYRLENIMTRNRLVMESRRFVEEQLAGLEKQLNNAEEALRTFREREGQVFLTDEARAALETFTKLEEQHNDVMRKRAEGERQIAVLNRTDAVLGNQTGRIFTEEQNALLTILNQRLLDLLQERNTLLINYTTDHPQVREQQQKIDNVRAEMVLELRAKLKTMQDREATLLDQRIAIESRYLQFPRAAIQMSRLERDVKVNADLLATLKSKHQELQIKSAEQIEEVTIIAPAIMPSAPINAPNTELNLMVSSFMGVFLGIVLAFARESFDTSIGTIEGVEEFLKVPVLGVIPQFDARRWRKPPARRFQPCLCVDRGKFLETHLPDRSEVCPVRESAVAADEYSICQHGSESQIHPLYQRGAWRRQEHLCHQSGDHARPRRATSLTRRCRPSEADCASAVGSRSGPGPGGCPGGQYFLAQSCAVRDGSDARADGGGSGDEHAGVGQSAYPDQRV